MIPILPESHPPLVFFVGTALYTGLQLWVWSYLDLINDTATHQNCNYLSQDIDFQPSSFAKVIPWSMAWRDLQSLTWRRMMHLRRFQMWVFSGFWVSDHIFCPVGLINFSNITEVQQTRIGNDTQQFDTSLV